MKLLSSAVVVCLLGIAPVSARATTVTVDLTGTVFDYYNDGSLDGSVTFGTPLELRFAYDDGTSAAAGTTGTYEFHAPPGALALSVGSYDFGAGPLYFWEPEIGNGFTGVVGDDACCPQGDYFSIGSDLVDPEHDFQRAHVTVYFVDSSGTALGSNDLAAVPLELSAWDEFRTELWPSRVLSITLRSEDGSEGRIYARIDAMHATVPEPASWLAALFALTVPALRLAGSRRARLRA